MALAMLGLSVPNFVFGPILVLGFALGLYWFPPARWGGISSLVLPVITLVGDLRSIYRPADASRNARGHAVGLYSNGPSKRLG